MRSLRVEANVVTYQALKGPRRRRPVWRQFSAPGGGGSGVVEFSDRR